MFIGNFVQGASYGSPTEAGGVLFHALLFVPLVLTPSLITTTTAMSIMKSIKKEEIVIVIALHGLKIRNKYQYR